MKKEYYIQGDPARAEEIKAAFEAKGCTLYRLASKCDSEDLIYYSLNGIVRGIKKDNLYLFEAHPGYKELELPIKPCFKVGDKIEATIYGIKRRVTIREVDKTYRCYFGTLEECIGFSEQDQWHLAPNPHYDIKNFHAGMPVLVRADNNCRWDYSVFSRITGNVDWNFAVCNGVSVAQCIPFSDDTKHLLGTNDPCGEEFINW